jgi:hypothetical protein
MPTFIKTGFWEKTRKGYKEWLNLDQLIQTLVPPPTPPTYKVYTAQIMMGDGSATVFENTLGVTITWTATSGQISSGAVTGLIGQNNVYVQVSSATASGNNIYIVSGQFTPSPWVVRVEQNDNTGSATNEQSVYVEIRVYP